MLRLPAPLERRLAEFFPRAAERQKFIVDTLSRELDDLDNVPQTEGPERVGGTLHLFTDGGSRGNPGEAAVAYILEDPVKGEVLEERGMTIGIETNNVAEYRALIEGLKAAHRFQPNRIICHLDSELVVRQLNGEYQVKMLTLKPYFDEVRALASDFGDVVFTHIPRGDNHRADALVNKALDKLKPSGSRRPPPPSYPPLHPQRSMRF